MSLVAFHAMEMGFATDVPSAIINSKGCDYFSDEDEDDDSRNYTRLSPESPSSIIAEARRILLRRTSTSSFDGDDDTPLDNTSLEETPLDDDTTVDDDRSTNIDDSYIRSGILIRTDNNGFAGKQKKSVKFNMDLNETIEFEKDNHSKLIENGTLFDSVLDAADLIGTDSESSSEDESVIESSKSEVRLAFSEENINDLLSESSSDSLITDDVDSKLDATKSEQLKVEEDLEYLKNEYDREMEKLREEYETRRKDYLTELDELQLEITEKRKQFGQEVEESEKRTVLDGKKEELEKEEGKLHKMEEDQQKRRNQCLEQEQELGEYERYLNRRHQSLNDKEADLKILHHELEQLSEILQTRKKKLTADNLRISEQLFMDNDKRLDPLKETEIKNINKKVHDLETLLRTSKNEVEKKTDNCDEVEKQLQIVELENKKLKQKIKHFEQSLDKRLETEPRPDSHYLRRTSMLTAGSLVNSNGDLNSPKTRLPTSPKTRLPTSPRPNRTNVVQESPPLDKMTSISESPTSDSPLLSSRDIEHNKKSNSPENQKIDTGDNFVKSRTCIVM